MPLTRTCWGPATVLAVYSLVYASFATPPSKLFNFDSSDAPRFNETSLWRVITWYQRHARYLSVVSCNSSDNTVELLTGILQNLKVPVLLSVSCDVRALNTSDNTSTSNHNYSEMSIGYLILSENFTIILANIHIIKKVQPYWNPRACLLIVLLISSCDEIAVSTYREFLHELWTKHGILNVLVSTLYKCNKRKDQIVYYDPFVQVNSSYRGEAIFLNAQTLQRFNSHVMDKLRNMNGYPIRISMFERKNTALLVRQVPGNESTSKQYYGSDGYALTELAGFMNFTPLTREPADGMEYGDVHKTTGRFTGAIGDILYDQADIAFNTRFIKDYRSDDVIFADQLSNDHVCVIVPKAKRIPKWLTMLTSFNKNVYFLLLVMYLAFPNIWLAFHKIRCRYLVEERAVKVDVGTLYLESLLPFVNMSMVRLPTRRPEMVLTMSCIVLGFLVDSMFQAKLLTTITKPVYYRDIDTLEQLDKSNLIITTGSSNLRDTFHSDTGNPVMDHLKAKTVLNSTGSQYDRVSQNSKYAGITRESDFLYRSQKYLTNDGMPLLHFVKECPVSYYLSFMLPKQSPFLAKINVFIRRIFEAGLVLQWDQLTIFNLIHSPKVGNSTTSDELKDGELRVFSVEDLQLPFFMLGMGHTIAACMFVVEVLLRCRPCRPARLSEDRSHGQVPFLH